MSKLSKLLVILVVLAMLAGCFASCDIVNSFLGDNDEIEDDAQQGDNTADEPSDEPSDEPDQPDEPNQPEQPDEPEQPDQPEQPEEPEFVDYASQVKFDPNSGRAWTYATVKSFIDGDTTHFDAQGNSIPGEYVKARYLAVNTPESTGVIEPWGKKASNYTKTQLQKATSIILESDTAGWDLDSTGGRYLLWIWYKTAEDTDYRNLNLEILQQGLAYGSNVASNVYGDIGLQILNQAKTFKLHVFSKDKDPDFYYGGAIELSLKEIKANCEKYEGKLVKFEAVVAKQVGPTIYVEEYDAENDMYFGMQIYAGYSYPRTTEDFAVGNRVSIVGTLQYYENGGTYQISNLKYKAIDPNWEGGCRVLSTGNSASYRELNIYELFNGKITLDTIQEIEGEDGEMTEILVKEEFNYGDLAHYSTATVYNLTVQSVYMTDNGGDSDGALTITCKTEDGITIKVRTASKLAKPDDSDLVIADLPAGTVLSVKGVIDSFSGEYQIKVFSYNDITFE